MSKQKQKKVVIKKKKKTKTNPNGANQFKVDPRQALFLKYYFDRKSETFSDGMNSALKAGFEKEYAKVITSNMPKWLSDYIKDQNLIDKATKFVDEVLDMDVTENKIGAFGPIFDKKTKKAVRCVNSGILKVKTNMTQFVLKGLEKEKWSERKEVTGANGQALIPEGEKREKIDDLIDEI